VFEKITKEGQKTKVSVLQAEPRSEKKFSIKKPERPCISKKGGEGIKLNHQGEERHRENPNRNHLGQDLSLDAVGKGRLEYADYGTV